MEPSVDFRSAIDANLAGLEDQEVLARAADAGRMLVTHDRKTMPDEFGLFIKTTSSPGVIVVPQHLPASTVADDILVIWGATRAEEWINRIFYLPI